MTTLKSLVSGSMERYTRLLLLFTYGLAKALEQRGGGLRVQHAPDAHQAATAKAGSRVGGFSVAGALTLVISDGWYCGDAKPLGDEAVRLQRSHVFL